MIFFKSMLAQFDLGKQFWVKYNASNGAIKEILSQLNEEEKL